MGRGAVSKLLLLLVVALAGLVALAALFLRMSAAARRPMLRLEREYEFMERAERERRARDRSAALDADGADVDPEEVREAPVRPIPLLEGPASRAKPVRPDRTER